MQSKTIHGKTLFPMLFSAAIRRWRRNRGGKYIPTRTNSALQGTIMEQQGPLHPSRLWEWGVGRGKGNSNRCQVFGDKKRREKLLHCIVKANCAATHCETILVKYSRSLSALLGFFLIILQCTQCATFLFYSCLIRIFVKPAYLHSLSICTISRSEISDGRSLAALHNIATITALAAYWSSPITAKVGLTLNVLHLWDRGGMCSKSWSVCWENSLLLFVNSTTSWATSTVPSCYGNSRGIHKQGPLAGTPSWNDSDWT